jgi:hypothetical protein
LARRQVEHDARLAGRAHFGAQCGHRFAVGEQQGVRGLQRQAKVSIAGSVQTHPVAEECGHPRLVDREPVLHSGAERGRDRLRVVAEPPRRVAIGPAAAVLQYLR